LTLRLGKYLFTLIVLGLAVHYLLPQLVTFEHSLQVLKKMSVPFIIGAALAQVLSYMSNGYLIRSLASTAGRRLTVLKGISMTLASSSVGLVAAGMVGNSAAMYHLMKHTGIKQESALLASWMPSILNSAALLVFAIMGMVQLILLHELSSGQAIGLGLAVLFLGLFAGVILWGVYNRPIILNYSIKIARRWARLRHHSYSPEPTRAAVERIFFAWDNLRSGKWRDAASGALGNNSFDLLTLYLVFIAAGYRVNPGLLLGGYGLPLLLSKFTFLPGGIGLVEGGMAAIYTGLGVPGATAVVVILTYRIISFWLPTLLGFPLFVYLQHVRRGTDHVAGSGGTGGRKNDHC